jgi:glutaredoxin
LRDLSVTFLTRSGCHLCDEARGVLDSLSNEIALQVEEVDIDTDDDLVKRYGLRVPVILAPHQRVIAEGIIDDPRALKDQIEAALSL